MINEFMSNDDDILNSYFKIEKKELSLPKVR